MPKVSHSNPSQIYKDEAQTTVSKSMSALLIINLFSYLLKSYNEDSRPSPNVPISCKYLREKKTQFMRFNQNHINKSSFLKETNANRMSYFSLDLLYFTKNQNGGKFFLHVNNIWKFRAFRSDENKREDVVY